EAQLRHSQKLEAVGRLAGGVAHDFNNMLNVILGYADLALTRTAPGERLHRDIQEIHLAAERSAQLTKQLLAFSRKQIIDPKVIDLNHEISRQLNLFRRIMGEDVEIIFSPAEDLWPVKMDPSQIDQILANLSTNARDALPGAGSVTIETSNVTLDNEYKKLHPYAEPGDYVLFSFSDSGSGMDPELLDHIFEPFFTTKSQEKGTGLGLATVYGIVKQNKGLIHVYSEPGKGSTFNIYLPRFQGEKLSPETKHKERPMKGNETILVVEDEDQVLDLSRKILERYDYTVLTASRPDEALELVRNHPDPIHLLLTDVIMPVMSGKELKEKIQEIIPDIRVLYMSGYTARVITQQGTMEEGVEFIQKPFSVNDLANKVRTILSSTPPQTTDF
ncbi:MAG: ATP-binding protein, partial [Desulfobacteraceae bacterium]